MKINFKLLNEKCGIYKIINTKNGKYYIGSSKNLYNRLHLHFFRLKNNKHHNKHLQYSYNKYGKEYFIYQILEFCTLEKQFTKEQYFINKYKPQYNKTYNVIANTGTKVSEECKNKIRNTLKKKYKNKTIIAYNQKHRWKKHYVYDIYSFKKIKELKNRKDCCEFLNIKGFINIDNRIVKNKYIITMQEYKNKVTLKNYIFKNYFKDNNNKYLIVIYNNEINYFLTKINLCKFINKNKSFYYKKIKSKEYYKYKNYDIYYTSNFIKLPS